MKPDAFTTTKISLSLSLPVRPLALLFHLFKVDTKEIERDLKRKIKMFVEFYINHLYDVFSYFEQINNQIKKILPYFFSN